MYLTNNKNNFSVKFFTLLITVLVLTGFAFYSCSANGNYNTDPSSYKNNNNNDSGVYEQTDEIPQDPIEIGNASMVPQSPLPASPRLNPDADNQEKKYTFYDEIDGKEVFWEVVVEKGEIVELYKDGNRIPGNEIAEHEDYIFEKLDEMRDDLNDLKRDLHTLNEDLHDMNFDFHFDSSDFHFEFDNDAFEKGMEALSEGLAKLKDMEIKIEFNNEDMNWNDDGEGSHFRFKFPDKDFEDQMNELKFSLKKLKKMNFDFDFDVDVDIDMNDFKESMKEFGKNMKNFKIDMKGFKKEMKIFKGFMKELKAELVKDGYLDETEDDFELELDEESIEINGKKLPDSFHDKVLKIYKENYGKDMDGEFRIR